jgi:hypothetical protein
MDSASISAFAALGGALIGGLTSFATSWLTQQTQARQQQLIHKLTRREDLYKDFIEEASKLYADSLVHDTADVSQLVRLYAMISMMRALSPATIVENADKVVRMIVNTYLAPNKTFPELRDMVNSGAIRCEIFAKLPAQNCRGLDLYSVVRVGELRLQSVKRCGWWSVTVDWRLEGTLRRAQGERSRKRRSW